MKAAPRFDGGGKTNETVQLSLLGWEKELDRVGGFVGSGEMCAVGQ